MQSQQLIGLHQAPGLASAVTARTRYLRGKRIAGNLPPDRHVAASSLYLHLYLRRAWLLLKDWHRGRGGGGRRHLDETAQGKGAERSLGEL